jgi:hypothetical protein
VKYLGITIVLVAVPALLRAEGIALRGIGILPMVHGLEAHATVGARLTVEVRNNTANGAPVGGNEVTLHLHRGHEQIESRSAIVDEDGRALFEDLPTAPGVVAVARARHQNMMFRSRPVSLHSAAGEFSIAVQVFDVSTDASHLSIDVHHLMIAVHPKSLEFTEYLQLNNSSDMAVTGSERDDRNRPIVLPVSLPEGFHDLAAASYFEHEALVITRDGFYDTMAVPPGRHQISFSYRVDLRRGAAKVRKAITVPTSQFMVFWQHGQGDLEGLGEPSDQFVNADGVPIKYYRRADLKPGDTLAFQISGLNPVGSDTSTWIVLGVVFAVVVIMALLRSRSRPVESGKTT